MNIHKKELKQKDKERTVNRKSFRMHQSVIVHNFVVILVLSYDGPISPSSKH